MVDGIRWPSKKQARVYVKLRAKERAGAITDLQWEKSIPLRVNGSIVCRYRYDFSFIRDCKRVILDVKGMKTPMYNLKKKLMQAVYGITIEEV